MTEQTNFVSVFESAEHTTPKYSDLTVRNALLWLKDDFFKPIVTAIRNEPDKEKRGLLKKKLYSITFSGTFEQRKKECLIQHSGFICIDVDNVENVEETKKIINADPYTYSSFISVSGNGLAFLIKIEPEKHLESFLAIEQYWFKKGITIDRQCKDVSRLRYVTYDPELYIFEKSLVWDIPYIKPSEPKRKTEKPQRKNYVRHTTNTAELVELVVSRIESTHTNITQNYDDWIAIALALNAEFGRGGEEWYHRISAIDSRYNETDCTYHYNKSSSPHTITISKFFKIAKSYGINTKFKKASVYS